MGSKNGPVQKTRRWGNTQHFQLLPTAEIKEDLTRQWKNLSQFGLWGCGIWSRWDQSDFCGGRKTQQCNYLSLPKAKAAKPETVWEVRPCCASLSESLEHLVISILSPHKCPGMKNHKKGAKRRQMLWRELGIKEVVFEPHLTGQDRTLFTEELKKKLIQQRPQCSYGTLVALLSPLWAKIW